MNRSRSRDLIRRALHGLGSWTLVAFNPSFPGMPTAMWEQTARHRAAARAKAEEQNS